MKSDDFFMNHIYLSEYWLWQHMEKRFFNHASPRWKKQRLDEKKHTAMARGALYKTLNRKDNLIVHDVSYSIEKSIYEKLGKIDVDNLPDEDFPSFCYIVERRADMLFKGYLKNGTNQYYKKVIRRLIYDEKDHLDIHKNEAKKTKSYEKYSKIDRELWNKISQKYSKDNKSFFDNLNYWKDLFSERGLRNT